MPDGTVPFLVKMCAKGGPKQIDCREALKNIDPVGTKKDAYCHTSSQKPIYPVCILDGKEYDVNDKGEVKSIKASGTRTADAASSTSVSVSVSASVSASASASATSTLSFATATNYASKATRVPESTLSGGSGSSNDDDATRTTDPLLRSTVDVTITIPPPAASTTAANAPMSSASAAGGSLMANGVVGSLVVAFFVEICILVLFGID
ncbi:hypothetical protein EMPG_13719 [Blastomyces silverae]|uniref:Uncharacterized protein n=1 Tax=Blastomyces silverae TaxID=2060906 RepID=A0A0H1BHK4_9EURO|nr:hypothetical protein EMPG_13719 [Blastomyces silverae]